MIRQGEQDGRADGPPPGAKSTSTSTGGVRIEEWRPVVGYPGYTVSSLGRVVSNRGREPRVLRGALVDGYRVIRLTDRRDRSVHSLVLEAFIGPRPVGLEIRHLDGDKTNNALVNLRYGTCSENAYDRVRHGTHHNAVKTRCHNGHPFDEHNTFRKSNGGRGCRTCRSEHRKKQALRSAGVAA